MAIVSDLSFNSTCKAVLTLYPGVYMQLHFKSKQGTGFITQEDSFNYGPDYSTKDLYNAIEKGDFPGWDVMVQTMDASTSST
jgi:catalase